VFTGLKPGQLVYVSAVQGAWSGRVPNGWDYIPQSCYTNGYVSCTDSDRNLIALHPLAVLAGQGLMVPEEPIELCVHVLDAPGYYFDNSENRGIFDPCSATFTRHQFPACRDGLDNDGDGSTDVSDSGCQDARDHSELSSDTGRTGHTDNSQIAEDENLSTLQYSVYLRSEWFSHRCLTSFLLLTQGISRRVEQDSVKARSAQVG
jgi:hypothetical protein